MNLAPGQRRLPASPRRLTVQVLLTVCAPGCGRSTIIKAEPFSMSEPKARLGCIAILWRGDEAARRDATPATSRFKAVFAALADVGVDAEPVVYEDDVVDAVRAQLAT